MSAKAPALDSTAAGRRAGIALAEQRGVVRYFGLGVASAAFIGLAGPLAIDDHDGPQIAVAVVGVGGLTTLFLGAGHARVPHEVEPQLAPHNATYVQGFRQGYRERLGQRRRRAALFGGVTGVGVGAGALYLLALALEHS